MGHAFLYGNGGDGKKLPVLNESYPENITVTAGDNATFMVLFDEEGKPADYTYTWYVNGSVVEDAKSQNYIRDTSDDKGVLTAYCEVTNKAGTVTSRTASLIVNKAPTLNGSYPADVSVDVTNSATFTVEVTDNGYPGSEITYQWYVNDSPVDGETRPSYTIPSAAKGITNVYCKVSNGVLSTNSRTARLTANKLWLFNNGDTCNAITGGWVATGGGSIDSVISTKWSNSYGGHAYTQKKIDISKFSTLCFNVSVSWGSATDHNCFAGAGDNQNSGTINNMSSYVQLTSTGTKACNISSLTGNYYVSIRAYLHVTEVAQVWLE